MIKLQNTVLHQGGTRFFWREAGRETQLEENWSGKEALARLPSSFWQNLYLVSTPLAFDCETWKMKRQFLTNRHTVRDYLKRKRKRRKNKRSSEGRAQHCWRISCLLTVCLSSLFIKPPWTDRLLQVLGTQHISYRQKQKRVKRNKQQGRLPKTFSPTRLMSSQHLPEPNDFQCQWMKDLVIFCTHHLPTQLLLLVQALSFKHYPVFHLSESGRNLITF